MQNDQPDGSAETPQLAFQRSRAPAFIRRKGHIGHATLTLLVALGCLPFVLAFARNAAMPSGSSLPLGGLWPLPALGEFLNRHLTLDWVPPEARPKILFLMLIPTGALLVAFARLTLGTRVLGLRAILIAIGFRAIGFLPSFSLLIFVAVTVAIFRPWTRRIRLPLYGRISAILCLSAMIMVGALLVAPSLRSEAVWSVAFFPVIIMAMIGESVAKTLESDNLVMTVWRVAWTIALALVVALIDPVTSRFMFRFPEFILTQLIAIIFIAEFFDLRLLEAWPERISRYLAGDRDWHTPKPKIAVVCNRRDPSVVSNLGRPAPVVSGRRTIQPHIDVLRNQGFVVRVFEGDRTLLKELGKFLPPNPRTGTPAGIVLNLATGVQGEGRLCHVPSMLEMAGLPYTGPDPQAHARLGDRFAMMRLLESAGVPVPAHAVIGDISDAVDIGFPASTRPRYEPDVGRTIVRNPRRLRNAIRENMSRYGQETVVEEIVPGREINVALLGNGPIECLPLLERRTDEGGPICPAHLDDETAEVIREHARTAFRAAGCRDYGRVRVRLSPDRGPVVIDVRWTPSFATRGAFVTCAEAAGYSFADLMRRVIDEAATRYVGRTIPTARTPSAALAPAGQPATA